MSWVEIVQQYPDLWVAVKDAEMDGADIVSGTVVSALPDKEMREFRIKNRGSGYVFRRTTEQGYNGPVTAGLKISVD